MNKCRLLPLMLVLALVLAPMIAADSDGDNKGNIGGVQFSHFGNVQEITVNETCVVSLSLYNDNDTDVLVKITKTDDSFDLVSGEAEYPIVSKKTTAITLEFKPDKDIRQSTYDVGIQIEVWDSVTGMKVTGTTTFPVKVTSIYSNEQYYNKILGLFENPLPDPFNNVGTTVAISLCLWVVIAALAVNVLQLIVNFAVKSRTVNGKKIDIRVRTPIFICIMMFAVSNCLRIYGVNESVVSTVIFWFNVIYVPLIAFIVWKVYKAIVYRVLNDLEKKTGNQYIYEAVSPLLHTIGKIAIVVVGTAIVLGTLGLNLAVIITGAGIAGLAVSLGTKSAFNELFSGITILVTRPFKVGDTIRIGEGTDEMRVENVGILRTEFVNKHNVDHFAIPNSTLAASKIVNYTRDSGRYRIYLYIKAYTDENFDLIRKILYEAAEEDPDIITDGSVSKPHIRFSEIDDGAVSIRLAVYIDDFEKKEYIYGRLREAMLRKFLENGISVPIQRIGYTIMEDKGEKDE